MSDIAAPSLGAEAGLALGTETSRRVRPGEPGDGERVRQLCRLAETLFYRGRHDEAAAHAEQALRLQPDSEQILDFCAWLFSNSGRHAAAAAVYERMLRIRPDWAGGHRHASGSYAAIGDRERAIRHATAASDLDPGAFEFAFHAGCLLEDDGRVEEAARYLARAGGLRCDHAGLLHRLSTTALALELHERALVLALRAVALDAEDRDHAVHAAELLLRAGRTDEAATLAAAAAARHPDDGMVWRLLSAAEMLRGRVEEALAAIERALDRDPQNPEYHLHRGHLLYRRSRFDEAAEAFGCAAALDPGNEAAKRARLTACFEAGRLTEAIAIGGDLVGAAPENEDYAQALLQVLNRRLDLVEGDYSVLADRGRQPVRRARPPRRFGDALATQRRVIHALIIRETRTRFGDSRLGYGWALLEPMLHILMLSLVFAVMMHGRPPIGEQFFIFCYTGIIPYHLFVHTGASMTAAVGCNGSLLQLPLVTTFDVVLARGVLEFVTEILVAIILLAAFAGLGLGAVPHDLAGASLSLIVLWLFACGCGFINAVLGVLWKSWERIWGHLTRVLYFCSGIFYVPGMMPDRVRDLLGWNPILHGVDWFRSAFFVDYAPHWLDRFYLATVAVLTLLLGIALERGLRRHLYEPA